MNKFLFLKKKKMERVSDIEDKRWMKKEYNGFVISRNHDLPAIVYGMRKDWYNNGKWHREKDLPAVICFDIDQNKYWFKKGKWHREKDLPSLIYRTGKKSWYKDGKFIK